MSNMTNEQYVAAGGCKCPVCGSESITGGPVEVDAGTAWQPITCGDCHANWNDVYNLVGYAELEA